jgi:hypothetical protein
VAGGMAVAVSRMKSRAVRRSGCCPKAARRRRRTTCVGDVIPLQQRLSSADCARKPRPNKKIHRPRFWRTRTGIGPNSTSGGKGFRHSTRRSGKCGPQTAVRTNPVQDAVKLATTTGPDYGLRSGIASHPCVSHS